MNDLGEESLRERVKGFIHFVHVDLERGVGLESPVWIGRVMSPWSWSTGVVYLIVAKMR